MTKVAAPLKTTEHGPRAVGIAPLDDYIGYSVRRAQIAIFDEFNRVFEPLDLRPAQFSVLLVISRNPGLNQSEVAASLGIQRANFVALIDRLEKRGLVKRRPLDRRSNALHLSAAGEALLARAVILQDELEASIEIRLGAGGKARLLELLRFIA